MISIIRKNKHWVILASAILLLAYNYFFTLFRTDIDAVLFYLFVPIALIVFVFRDKLKHYGFGLGRLKVGLALTVFVSVLAVLVTFFASKYLPSVRAFYGHESFTLIFVLGTVAYMLGWEFILRGYLLFGLMKRFGAFTSNMIQTLLFFLMHIGKPSIELYSTLVTGLIFGYICLRSKSFWPMVVIHTVIKISLVLFLV